MTSSNEMKYKSGNVAYFQNQISGPTVIFLHGNSASSGIFENQFKDNSLSSNRLIALDLPGHGETGQAEDRESTYSLSGCAQVVCEFLDSLALEDVILVGHSLGGHLAMEVAARDSRIKGIMVIGAVPAPHDPTALERMFKPSALAPLLFQENLSEDEKHTFVTTAYNGGEIPSFAVADLDRTDKTFRPLLGASVAGGQFSDEAKFVSETSIPVAMVFGKEDELINVDFLQELTFANLWKNEAVILPGGHAPFWSAPEAFNRVLTEFREDTRQAETA